jgi:hypothetical protein
MTVRIHRGRDETDCRCVEVESGAQPVSCSMSISSLAAGLRVKPARFLVHRHPFELRRFVITKLASGTLVVRFHRACVLYIARWREENVDPLVGGTSG